MSDDKKPTIALRPKTKAEFIDSAEAEKEPEIEKQKTTKIEKHNTRKQVKQESIKMVNKETGKVKIMKTILLTREENIAWKRYELEQLENGKNVSFQGAVLAHLHTLLKKYL